MSATVASMSLLWGTTNKSTGLQGDLTEPIERFA